MSAPDITRCKAPRRNHSIVDGRCWWCGTPRPEILAAQRASYLAKLRNKSTKEKS